MRLVDKAVDIHHSHARLQSAVRIESMKAVGNVVNSRIARISIF